MKKPTMKQWVSWAEGIEAEKPTMEQVWGEPCPDYEPGCPVCEAYALREAGVEPTEDAVYMVCVQIHAATTAH